MILAIPFIALMGYGAQAKAPAISITPLKTLDWFKPLALAPGPRGSLFVAGLEDRSVILVKAEDRSVLHKLVGHPQSPMAVAWSRDGTIIASGDESARIITWNAETGSKLLETRGHQRGIQNLAFNFPRTILASTGKDDVVKFWDPGTGKELKTIAGNGANFYGGAFRAKSTDFGVGTLVEGARTYDPDGKALGSYNGHHGQGVFEIAFNAAGTRAVTAGGERGGRGWGTENPTPARGRRREKELGGCFAGFCRREKGWYRR